MARNGRPALSLFALLLIAVGVVLLLQNLGVLSWELWLEVWRFWPVLLIAIGVGLVLGQRLRWLSMGIVAALLAGSIAGAALLAESTGDVDVDHLTVPLDDSRSLDLWVAFGLGSLTIDSLPDGSPNLVEGTFESRCAGPEIRVRRDGDAVSLDIEREDLDAEMDPGGLALCFRDADWRLSLSRAAEVTIDLGLGAASIDLDLTDLKTRSLYMDGGAASVDIRMPAGPGDMEAVISVAAASIDVRIPGGVEAFIVNDTNLSSFDVDRRFPSLDLGSAAAGRPASNVYQSPGYRESDNRIRLEVLGGVSSVNVR